MTFLIIVLMFIQHHIDLAHPTLYWFGQERIIFSLMTSKELPQPQLGKKIISTQIISTVNFICCMFHNRLKQIETD